MKRYLIILCFLFSHQLYSQCIILRSDTLVFYQLDRIDTLTKGLTASATIFSIDSSFYEGDNFPFFCFDCEESATETNNLFLRDYKPIIDEKSINKFIKAVAKKKSISISNEEDKTIQKIRTCLITKYRSGFYIKKQRAVCTFFVLTCKLKRGSASSLFCEEYIDLQRIPVILKVEELL